MKLFIPWLGYNHNVTMVHSLAMMELALYCQANKIPLTIFPITFESLISRGRNAGVAAFLSDPDATHLLFIDSDIEFHVEDVKKLLAADKDIVCGAYARKFLDRERLKQHPTQFELCTRSALELFPSEEPAIIASCEYVATGFLCIKRSVFETLIQKYPERQYINDIDGYGCINPTCFYDFFAVKINPITRRYDAEDYGFSCLVREAGFTIYCYTDMMLVHHGWFGYPLNMYQQMCEYKTCKNDL